ncbi:hypothetical protein D9619_011529 [Psilocybe cf. subviscida]|uniref:peptidylprolyl isomerase n=1 Tax=Psilocybe cf. subviscida TaxID=2480587 RepID=A0A8H5F9K8_9AGAR|nr:hypothetical protein D9619_011529 [Psilocybe cf. subviscida]
MKFFSWLSIAALGAIATVNASEAKVQPTELGIEVTHLPESCTQKAKSGDTVQVHYTGTLFDNGEKFDSSVDRGQPLPFKLGVGQVIKGWDKGIEGMCVGEKRTLTIPSDMAYGSRGAGGRIPPNAALVFTTELMGLDAVHSEL